jgi:hypothetical protein
VTDTQQESGWKRWFTSGRAIAIAAVGAVAAIAGVLANITTIRDWFKPRLHDIEIRYLEVVERYAADLYNSDRQDHQGVWARSVKPV